jgi:hypothetical protein
VISVGTQAPTAPSARRAAAASQYISVYIDDVEAHYQRARAVRCAESTVRCTTTHDYRAYRGAL